MRITVNGLDQDITYDRHMVEEVLVPRLSRWIEGSAGRGRRFAFLVAPPGAGKSTLGLLLERSLTPRLQCLGIDGFHRYQRDLDRLTMVDDHGRKVPMADRKGAPETFDVMRLEGLIRQSLSEDVIWPVYDRRRHDPTEDGVPVSADHVLLEGNWLLLDEPPWSRLRRYADLVIYVHADEDLVHERLVARKVLGGMDRSAAEDFYLHSDRANVRRVLTRSHIESADVLLELGADGLLTERTGS
ncbi:hypothetical protein [Arsenicicoccus bolidensis]|uniref:hypothetical protein n=1 Tax=Arsenicicoccus bolidensis TaxID=229480 RepID=UPI0028A92738|nr:hypothetical protein [Arsenicicoccus bolidensis]